MKKILYFLVLFLAGLFFFNNTTNVLAEECSHLNYNSKSPRYDINPCKPKPQECAGRSLTALDIANFPPNFPARIQLEALKALNPEAYNKQIASGIYECWPAGATPRDTLSPTRCEIGYDYSPTTNECCPNDPLIPWDQRASLCKKASSTTQCETVSTVTKKYKYNPETGQCVEVFPEDAGTIKIIKPTACCFSRDSLTGTCDTDGIQTSLGCFPTNPGNLVSWLFMVAVGVGGGIAFLIAIYGAFLFMTSAGDPEKLKEAQATLTASIMGILFIIFSVFLLRLIGFTILKIPGWA